jgi:hypothetical protein
MKKNKGYIFIILLTVILIFGVASTCSQCWTDFWNPDSEGFNDITKSTSKASATASTTMVTTEATTVTTEAKKVSSIIRFSDGVISDPLNSSESDFFSKLILEQGLVDSSGGYLLGGKKTVEGCDGTMSGIYDPNTRQFTGKYWDQIEIGPKSQPSERYIMNGTFSEVIGHSGKVSLKLEGTQYHEKLNYEEDEKGVWLYKDRIEWSETVNSSRDVTFTVVGLD